MIPIPISDKQKEVIHSWADNNRTEYWGSSDAREHNLTIFARQILGAESVVPRDQFAVNCMCDLGYGTACNIHGNPNRVRVAGEAGTATAQFRRQVQDIGNPEFVHPELVREYSFDRYREGRRMAQGCTVRACSGAEAEQKAKALFHPWDARDKLHLRTEKGEYFDLQLMEDALFMAAAVDANSDRAERMRELGERIHNLKPKV